MSDANGDVISDNEVEKLCRALLVGRKQRGATEDELQQVIDWAHRVRVEATMLDMVLAGRLLINDVEPELTFALNEKWEK